MRKIMETYNGVNIWGEWDDKEPFPYITISTVQENVPVIGSIETIHDSIADAKEFIDKHLELLKQ
jgi:hypothetical protein